MTRTSPMHLPPRIFRILLALCLGTVLLRGAPDGESTITGVYDDEGMIAVPPPGDPPPVVSLHALLTLQFIPGIISLLHDETGEVRLTHTAGQLKMEITNREGEVAWTRTWRAGDDYDVRAGRVVLRFKAVRDGGVDHLLLLDTVTAHKLLQIEVQRHTPTVLGPKIESLGTYLFSRRE